MNDFETKEEKHNCDTTAICPKCKKQYHGDNNLEKAKKCCKGEN